MFERLNNFWEAFMEALTLTKKGYRKNSYNQDIQAYQDVSDINFLAICVSKITNLACTEATFELESESTLTEKLKALLKDIESERFNITSQMLGGGDFYVMPSTDEKGELYHSYLDSSRVRILDSKNGKITKLCAIVDYYQPNKSSQIYYLQRIHTLEDDGTLYITYQTVNERGKEVRLDYFGEMTELKIANANHIGVGRYKSPTSSRGLATIYGVPMNFGCGKIEKDIKETLKQIANEFENGASKVFADPRVINVEHDESGKPIKKKMRITGNIFPINTRAGVEKSIDIYSPALRGSEHFEKLQKQLGEYEEQIGLSKGILTDNEAMATGTATAVRRSNTDTISFINSVHAALDKGNREALEADSIFLNIRFDLWEYNSDYFDPFNDPTEQFNFLLSAYNIGAITLDRITTWLNPQMTKEQAEEEIKKAAESRADSNKSSIESMLNM